VFEREVNDTVGRRRGPAQAVGVVEVASMDLGNKRDQFRGGLVGAGDADDLMARIDELGNEGGADVSGRASDENSHRPHLQSWVAAPSFVADGP
jgi:hypothetical protein